MATSPKRMSGRNTQDVITSVAKVNGGNVDSERADPNSRKQSSAHRHTSGTAGGDKRASVRDSFRDSFRQAGAKLSRLLSPTSLDAEKMSRENSLKSHKPELVARQKKKSGVFGCFGGAEAQLPMIGAELETDFLQLQKLQREFVPKKPILPPQRPEHRGRITLLLDLDETLVHSTFERTNNADYAIPLDLGGGEFSTVFVRKRPYVDYFLREVAQYFEVVIFTASLSLYADPLLDRLDKSKTIAARLYREHCVFVGGNYVKDMTLLGRPMSKVILVDNSPVTYAFQPENALPCTTWISDGNDDELNDILSILKLVRNVPDVRNCRL
mmetsp:Transcript_8213/g.14865  ORF Transcript_8213/g.14865 Transcript_8213/m.14865 type:complete len:327 (-) Transcript_8213:990-1970(-)|eukprot:CAMPEP_0182446964 /NCGR_PEP_ID=MMETSP1172-20130603/9458_1 /TAXON_ID=708627 /ORGANISM="Timspurckia oligopyrenoides, Strain CCMP3278" /LENGTH=326 /DNA_ID=CAMNT_0024643175 /DNA_START=252 /DNA_END=1232 /DNA_ORIENTATION=+